MEKKMPETQENCKNFFELKSNDDFTEIDNNISYLDKKFKDVNTKFFETLSDIITISQDKENLLIIDKKANTNPLTTSNPFILIATSLCILMCSVEKLLDFFIHKNCSSYIFNFLPIPISSCLVTILIFLIPILLSLIICKSLKLNFYKIELRENKIKIFKHKKVIERNLTENTRFIINKCNKKFIDISDTLKICFYDKETKEKIDLLTFNINVMNKPNRYALFFTVDITDYNGINFIAYKMNKYLHLQGISQFKQK